MFYPHTPTALIAYTFAPITHATAAPTIARRQTDTPGRAANVVDLPTGR